MGQVENSFGFPFAEAHNLLSVFFANSVCWNLSFSWKCDNDVPFFCVRFCFFFRLSQQLVQSKRSQCMFWRPPSGASDFFLYVGSLAACWRGWCSAEKGVKQTTISAKQILGILSSIKRKSSNQKSIHLLLVGQCVCAQKQTICALVAEWIFWGWLSGWMTVLFTDVFTFLQSLLHRTENSREDISILEPDPKNWFLHPHDRVGSHQRLSSLRTSDSLTREAPYPWHN